MSEAAKFEFVVKIGLESSLMAIITALATANGIVIPAAGKPSSPAASGNAPSAPASPAAVTTSPAAPVAPVAASEGAETDAAGIAWDAAKHAGTKAKVASGLWRMKVGVKRADGEGEDSPNYIKPGASAPASAGSASPAAPNATPAPPAPPAAPIDPNRPTDPGFRHDNGDGTEQWYVNDAWDGGTHAIPSAAPAAPVTATIDPDDEFAAFATANGAAPVAPAARNWSDADLGKLCNQAATAVGAANVAKVKDIIAKYIPAGEPVQHSRNIPADQREAFARDVETSLGITYAG